MLNSQEALLSSDSSKQFTEDFLIRLMDGLKYHIMPFLEETGVSGIVENAGFCAKTYMLFRFIEFLT